MARDIQMIYHKLSNLILSSFKEEFPFETNKHTAADASAQTFNILCVAQGIRPAMLFDDPISAVDGEQTAKEKAIIARANNQLFLNVQRFLNTYLPHLDILHGGDEHGDFFIYNKSNEEQFLHTTEKTDMLGYCDWKEGKGPIITTVAFNDVVFYGNRCREEEHFSSLRKFMKMYRSMYQLAKIVNGKLQFQITFNPHLRLL
jgi:hypothetical protein